MGVVRRSLDTCQMVSATEQAKSHYQDVQRRAEASLNDIRRAERMAANECKRCFYLVGRAGGAQCTSSVCAHCGREMRFGSTNVDILCQDCAKELSLCCHCGGDREMRVRRKWPTVGSQIGAPAPCDEPHGAGPAGESPCGPVARRLHESEV